MKNVEPFSITIISINELNVTEFLIALFMVYLPIKIEISARKKWCVINEYDKWKWRSYKCSTISESNFYFPKTQILLSKQGSKETSDHLFVPRSRLNMVSISWISSQFFPLQHSSHKISHSTWTLWLVSIPAGYIKFALFFSFSHNQSTLSEIHTSVLLYSVRIYLCIQCPDTFCISFPLIVSLIE